MAFGLPLRPAAHCYSAVGWVTLQGNSGVYLYSAHTPTGIRFRVLSNLGIGEKTRRNIDGYEWPYRSNMALKTNPLNFRILPIPASHGNTHFPWNCTAFPPKAQSSFLPLLPFPQPDKSWRTTLASSKGCTVPALRTDFRCSAQPLQPFPPLPSSTSPSVPNHVYSSVPSTPVMCSVVGNHLFSSLQKKLESGEKGCELCPFLSRLGKNP